MKLLGIEFSNLGLLAKQYVPLDRQMTMLVGRNNVGKSALLNAIRALKELPSNGHAHSLTAYSRGDVEIAIRCQAEANDELSIVQSPSWWKSVVAEHRPEIVYRFIARPSHQQVSFLDGAMHVHSWSALPFLVVEGNAVVAKQYDGPTPANHRPANIRQGLVQQSTATSSGGTVHVTTATGAYLRGFEKLGSCVLINPHRVITPNLPLQTVTEPSGDGGNLSQFLHTLYSNDRRKYLQIESLITDIFPIFESLDIRNQNNQSQIKLTTSGRQVEIPLNRCGTGVEQVLALATFAICMKPGTLFLVDEPHSFLHPVAERKLIRFLLEQEQQQFVIATHSAVMMNAVSPDSITYIEPPGHGYDAFRREPEVGTILFDLGYRNSDVMFNDRLIVGEGATEISVLPLLLRASGQFPTEDIERTGYAALNGVPESSKDQQTAILRFERFLHAVGRNQLPRTYLFDRDRSDDDRKLLVGTRPSTLNGLLAPVKFLTRMEIENYLLVPDAIAQAMNEEASLTPVDCTVTSAQVETALRRVMAATDDSKLYPRSVSNMHEEQLAMVKGSLVLERLYTDIGPAIYNKKRTGALIAKFITRENQPALLELTGLLQPLFSPEPVSRAASG